MNLIRNARLRARTGLFSIAWSEGRITAVQPQADTLPVLDGEEGVLDAGGQLVIPPFVEPHIHLDAALTAGEPNWNLSGTLFEGIERWAERKALVTPEDTKSRAHRTIRMLAAHGIQHVRSHVDVTEPGLSTLQAMLEVREEARALVDLQIVAFPQEGIESFANGRALMSEAVEMGVDVVGGIPHFEKALEREPDNFYALFGIADCYRGIGKQGSSLEYWNRILAKDPKNKVILTRAGDAYRNIGDLDKATKYYEDALNIEFDVYAILGLAVIARSQGKWDDAITSLRMLVQNDPKNYRIYLELAQCYIAAGQRQQAVDVLSDFTKMGIKNHFISEALMKLTSKA